MAAATTAATATPAVPEPPQEDVVPNFRGGDYLLQVHLIEVRDLGTVDESFDPVCEVKVCNFCQPGNNLLGTWAKATLSYSIKSYP